MTRALRSPLALILLVIGAVVGLIWLGPAGVLIGLVGYGAGALLSLPKSPARGPAVDPFAVNEPWRRFVQSALRSQRRFRDGVNATREGPLRDHLDDIGQRVEDAVAEVWRIAQRGNTIAKARRQIDEPALRRKVEALRPEAGTDDPNDAVAKTVESLEAQLASGARMDELLSGTESQLELLDARLAESVTRGHELAATADATADLDVLGADLDSIVTEMESVRAALDETRAADPTIAPPLPRSAIGPGDEGGAIPDMPAAGDAAPAAEPAPSGDATDDPGDPRTGPTAES